MLPNLALTSHRSIDDSRGAVTTLKVDDSNEIGTQVDDQRYSIHSYLDPEPSVFTFFHVSLCTNVVLVLMISDG